MAFLELSIQLMLALVIIIIIAQVLGRAIRYIGQPSVVGEMISGVLLGPSVFGYFAPELSKTLFPQDIMPVLFIISNLGLSIYMFLIGAELNLELFNRKALKDATALSVAAIIIPFFLGGAAALIYNEEINSMHIDSVSLFIFLGTALAITAFPMLARILQEKNLVNSKLGSIAILSASIQDVISWIMLGLVTIMCTTKAYSKVFLMLAGVVVLIFLMFYVVKPALRKIAIKVNKSEDLSTFDFGIVLLLLLISALITDILGLYSVFGGFILGLALPRQGYFIRSISLRIKDFTLIALVPVFFTFSGLNTNILNLFTFDLLVPTLVILFLSFASKYFSCLFTMRFISKFSWRESSAMGALINSRGLMELLIANIGLTYGLIDRDLYSILILVAVCSSLAALPLYSLSMGKSGRDFVDVKL